MRMQVLIHTLKTCFWKQISHELFIVVRISIICKALKSKNHSTILMIAFCGIFAAKCKHYFRQNIRLYSNLRHLCHTDIIFFVHGDTLPFSPWPPFLSPYLFHNWKCFARLNVKKCVWKQGMSSVLHGNTWFHTDDWRKTWAPAIHCIMGIKICLGFIPYIALGYLQQSYRFTDHHTPNDPC